MEPVKTRRSRSATGLSSRSQAFPDQFQELTMADVAFVVTMIAVFALMAVIARGVAKL